MIDYYTRRIVIATIKEFYLRWPQDMVRREVSSFCQGQGLSPEEQNECELAALKNIIFSARGASALASMPKEHAGARILNFVRNDQHDRKQ